MMPSIISRFLTLTVFVLSQKCVSGTIAFPHSSNSDNENHSMLRRQEPAEDLDFGFNDKSPQRRELWGFSNMLYHIGVCPGPKMCGPPPCSGSQPKPDHWHCNSTSNDNSASDASYASSGEEDVVTAYSAEVSDRTASLTDQQATSEKNMWMYVAGAAAFTAMVAGVAYRKRYASRNVDGEHLLHGSLGKRLGFSRGGSKLPDLPDSPPPSFIEMPGTQGAELVHARSGISTSFVKL